MRPYTPFAAKSGINSLAPMNAPVSTAERMRQVERLLNLDSNIEARRQAEAELREIGDER